MFYDDSDEEAPVQKNKDVLDEQEKENWFRDPLEQPSSPDKKKNSQIITKSSNVDATSPRESNNSPVRPTSSRALAAKRALQNEEKRKARQQNSMVVQATENPVRPTTAAGSTREETSNTGPASFQSTTTKTDEKEGGPPALPPYPKRDKIKPKVENKEKV